MERVTKKPRVGGAVLEARVAWSVEVYESTPKSKSFAGPTT